MATTPSGSIRSSSSIPSAPRSGATASTTRAAGASRRKPPMAIALTARAGAGRSDARQRQSYARVVHHELPQARCRCSPLARSASAARPRRPRSPTPAAPCASRRACARDRRRSIRSLRVPLVFGACRHRSPVSPGLGQGQAMCSKCKLDALDKQYKTST